MLFCLCRCIYAKCPDAHVFHTDVRFITKLKVTFYYKAVLHAMAVAVMGYKKIKWLLCHMGRKIGKLNSSHQIRVSQGVHPEGLKNDGDPQLWPKSVNPAWSQELYYTEQCVCIA